MLPTAPLMVEHRIIERMIRIMKNEIDKLKYSEKINVIFIDTTVDFIRTYADATHHGKEEDILFRELKGKDLTSEHRKQMEDLIQEHMISRKTTGELVAAKEKYIQGDKTALPTIIAKMEFLVDFYPRHIEKEDKYFFPPIMSYFSKEEQQKMLEEGHDFDRKMIHKKYDKLVGEIEQKRGIAPPQRASKWLDFM